VLFEGLGGKGAAGLLLRPRRLQGVVAVEEVARRLAVRHRIYARITPPCVSVALKHHHPRPHFVFEGCAS